MTWQTIIILQIIVSSIMTIFTRQLTLTSKKMFFAVGVVSYVTVACAGWVISILYGDGMLSIPPSSAWPYLIVQGLFIPAAWLTQYKLISNVGAGNAMIVTTLNTLGTAMLGIIFLQEGLTLSFILGTLLVLCGVVIALRLKPDSKNGIRMSFYSKLLLTVLGAVFFAAGMYSEKIAINSIGASDYVAFGWSLQAIGAITLFGLFGRNESAHFSRKFIGKGILLGLLTSIAGGLYIYALSLGTLSQTIVATSGKIVVVMLLAAVFLRERNAVGYKLAAFLLTVSGIWLILK
jgi:drug/metabolite transporter (DMT)-like permease